MGRHRKPSRVRHPARVALLAVLAVAGPTVILAPLLADEPVAVVDLPAPVEPPPIVEPPPVVEPAPPAAEPPPSCSSYADVDTAQAALDADPGLAPLLDTDQDGRACEARWPRTRVEDAVDDAADAVTDVVDDLTGTCRDSGFDGVEAHVAVVGHHLAARFAISVDVIGGVAARARASDHPLGLALDFPVDRDTGDELAAYVLAHQAELRITYVIWRQRINFGSGWEPMEDRGSATANHFDHVHLSLEAGADVPDLTC